MENWVAVLSADALQEGSVVKVSAAGRPLIIIRVAGSVYALLNECPHLGCTMHRGELDGYLLKCPCHDWIFDIRTGEFITAPEIKIPIFTAKAEHGEIRINLGGEKE